ncbi:MAG: BrnT family toxin [Spirochaetaceae bacterium]|nr:BrnT family toxin [Spirochaetaceae bacterium]
MRFEWEAKKNQGNIRKHGVSFEEAREVFDDPLHIALLDERFTYFQERWITIGATKRRRLVVAANLYFDDHDDEVVRIISAREATINERRQYKGND